MDPRMTAYEVNRQVKAETERRGKRNLFKLTLKGLRNPGLGFSEEMFSEICHLADFRDMTRPDYNLEELKLQYRGTLLGDYLDSFGETESRAEQIALFEGIQALMEAGV